MKNLTIFILKNSLIKILFCFIICSFLATTSLFANWVDEFKIAADDVNSETIFDASESVEANSTTIENPDVNSNNLDSTKSNRAVNYWDGSADDDWHNDDNWTLGHVPTSDEGVVITSDGYHPPVISSSTAYCHDIEFESGAALNQTGGFFRVFGDLNSDNGTFTQSGSSYLYFVGDDLNGWDDDNEDDTYRYVRIENLGFFHKTIMMQDMTCSGNFEIREGIFEMSAGHTLTVTNSTSNAFEVEDGGKLVLDNHDEGIEVSGGVVFRDGSRLESVWNASIHLGGDLLVENNTLYNIDIGVLVLDGSTSPSPRF